jgi:hypothetical protein
MKDTDFKSVLKRAIELVRPDLRSYYRVVRKAKIVKTYASNGQYWADVQPLRNDESIDAAEPVIPKVEIPVIWAGPNRGVVCPPANGVHCDLEYYDGDPNYPRISNFRWHGMGAPSAGIGELVIQQADGTYIKIDAGHNIIHVTPANWQSEAGENWTIAVGGNAMITASGQAGIAAPTITLAGNVVSTGAGGGTGTATEKCNKTQTGNLTLVGDLAVQGNISATGTIIDTGGNTNHHSH